MLKISRQQTDPAVCGRCGSMGYVRDSVRYCSACGMTTVGCTCTGDRRQSAPEPAGGGSVAHDTNRH